MGTPGPEFEPKSIGDAYRATPYRPDTVIDGWSDGAFVVRAASMRGHLHRYNGAPRQDDVVVTLDPNRNRLIVAVADGVSAATQSHLGATSVVRYGSQWLAKMAPPDLATTDWRALMESAAWALIEQAGAALSLSDVDAAAAESLMATTLTCAVCEPLVDGRISAWLVGVGDSGAWTFGNEGYVQVLGGKAVSAAGLSSSAVSGLPQVPSKVEAIQVTLEHDQVLLVGSDGFGDPLGGGTGEVGALFSAVLTKRPPSLIEFAHALDFSRETFDDDRTLVAVWPQPTDT